MTNQPENKEKAEQKVSKDELTDNELAKVTGGDGKTTTTPAPPPPKPAFEIKDWSF